MSDLVVKVVTLSTDELEALLERAVEKALKNQNSADESMLNAKQAGELLGFSADWVYRNWRKVGGRKVGKRGVRFRRADLQAWIDSRKV